MVRLDLDIEDNVFDYIDLKDLVSDGAPDSPSLGYGRLYFLADELLLKKDDGSFVSIGSGSTTYSNAGTAGVSIILTKVLDNLPFKAINGGTSGTVTATDNPTTKTVDLDVVDASTSQKGAVLLGTSAHSSAGRVVQTNDARLTDTRIPTSHHTTHENLGSDAIKLDDLATPDDNTDLNSSTSRHGLLPKLSGVGTEFLNGNGGWATPAGGGGGAPTGASYVTLNLDGTLSSERVLTAGTNIGIVDGGANTTVTLNVPDASTSTKGAVELATSVEITAGLAVQASDTRLSDSRTPTTHKDSHKAGGSDAFVKGDDLNASSRYLEDIADPTSDAQRIWLVDGGSDVKYWDDQGTPVKQTIERQSNKGATSGYASLDGSTKVPIAQLPDANTSAKGISQLSTSVQTTAGLVVQASDTRLSDARTPTTHKDSHKAGGSDPFVKGDDLNASSRYLEDVADMASDAQRIWIEDATANVKYWSDEGTPVKHTIANLTGNQTFSSKNISPTNNVMPFLDTYSHTIYQDGGVVKCRNNKTGVVTSNATLGPLVAAVLASGDPSVEIQSGTYNLASGFTAWVPPNYASVKFQHNTYINVPQGYNDTVWELSPTSGQLHDIHIDGGDYSEQGASPTFLWTAFRIAPTGANVGVLLNTIENVNVAKSSGFLYMNTNGTSWANTNIFRNIWVKWSKYCMFWEHTGTYTSNASGPCSNLFEKVGIQASGAAAGVSPLTLGGVIGVFGQYNTFLNCEVWDLAAENPTASSMTLGIHSESTMILNGLMTHLNFEDLGINTMVFDTWKGLYTRNSLNIIPTASAQETMINCSVSDAPNDNFYFANNTSAAGMFGSLFRHQYNGSSSVDQWTAGMWFQTISKLANDISNSIACNVISAHNHDNTILQNRAILDIENRFNSCYTFYPSYADFTNKSLKNATINPTNNAMPYLNSFTYTIYKDGGVCKLRNNKTGAITSNNNLDPLITAVLTSGDPSVEIQSDVYNLSSGFAGWDAVSKMNICFQPNTFINVPSGFAGEVWDYSPAANATIYYAYNRGGIYDEQAPQSNNWLCFSFQPADGDPLGPVYPGAVYACEISDAVVWRCNGAIYLHTNNESWINQNRFKNIWVQSSKFHTYFDHTGTFTSDQSGCNNNYFLDCSIQASAADGTNHYPAVIGGIYGINGNRNMFVHCNMWDFHVVPTAITSTITANATDTIVDGGIMTSQNYSNAGKRTRTRDWGPLGDFTSAPVNVASRLTVNGNTTDLAEWQAPFVVDRVADGGFEAVGSFNVGGSSDSLAIENGTSASGSFHSIIRAITLSTNSPATLESLFLGGYIKDANDVTNSVPVVNITARKAAGNLSLRPMVGIGNHFDYEYLFYPTYMDFTNNGMRGVHHIDLNRISAPGNPPSNESRISFEQIDSNNDGLFLYIKKAGGFVKLQLA